MSERHPQEPISKQESGRRAGQATLRRHGIDHFRSAGLKGGEAVLEKYGREYYARLGRLSAAKRAEKRRKAIEAP